MVLCPGKGSGRDEPLPWPDSGFPPGWTLRPACVSEARADPMLKANRRIVYASLFATIFVYPAK